MEDTLKELLAEQRRTNELLGLLIDALADQDEPDPDAAPETYLDDTPCR